MNKLFSDVEPKLTRFASLTTRLSMNLKALKLKVTPVFSFKGARAKRNEAQVRFR